MPKLQKLFEDNDDQDSDIDLKTNTDYATKYDSWRQKEELNKLKTKYGESAIIDTSEDESTSEEEDEGQQLPEEFQKDFFKTLSCLKNKDPRIYDENVTFFSDKIEKPVTNKKQDKPFFLKDYERKMILEHDGKFSSDSEDENKKVEDPRAYSPTYVEEQQKLKDTFKKIVSEDDNDENDWGGLFKKRMKTKAEQHQENEDYREWLKGQKEQLGNETDEKELKSLKDFWNNPNLSKEEQFLRDYVLNKKYLEEDDENYVPTYDEIIHDSDENLSEDEKAIDNQEEFEHKYNYRFEEPDQDFIKRYPRTMDHTVRKTDDRRKQKRAEIKQRKEEEKKQMKSELKQLKILKKKEIQEKIEKLKEITGNNDIGFHDNDLEEDFNPDDYDKRMNALFNDEYYDKNEGDYKPEFPDIEEELGPWKDDGPHCEDDNFNMDCDYDPTTPGSSEIDDKKKKKKRNRFDKKKTKTDPDEDLPVHNKEYDKYIDEYYKLDYEDMIGDIPCRFKYREVLPNTFGLTIGEILMAKDRELNRWCSLKKAVQYRPEHVEKYDVIAYQRKSANEALKKKLLPSLYENFNDDEEQNQINENRFNEENEGKSYTNNINETENLHESKEENNGRVNFINEDSEITKNSNIKDASSMEKRKKAKTKLKETIENDENNGNVNFINEGSEIIKISNNKDSSSMEKKKKAKNKLKETVENDENNDNVNFINEDSEKTENSNIKDAGSVEKKKRKKKKTKKKLKETIENNSLINKSNIVNTEKNNIGLNETTSENSKLSRRQKKNKKKKHSETSSENKLNVSTETLKKNRKRKLSGNEQGNVHKKKKSNDDLEDISRARLAAYGINPKRHKNKMKYKTKNNVNNKNKSE